MSSPQQLRLFEKKGDGPRILPEFGVRPLFSSVPPLPSQIPIPKLDLVSIFADAHRQIRPRTAVPEIRAGLFPFAGLNHTVRLRAGCLYVRVSDIFDDAPSDVVQSLALLLLARLYRKSVDAALHESYRKYILRDEIQDRARAARSKRGRGPKATGSLGRHVDLSPAFDRLNQEYFGSRLRKPVLSWSSKRSRRILGRYDIGHHTIVISRIFDSPKVPAHVIDYIMFHEMLHIKHRTRPHASRMIVHSPEFKQEERSFAHYRTATEWLKEL